MPGMQLDSMLRALGKLHGWMVLVDLWAGGSVVMGSPLLNQDIMRRFPLCCCCWGPEVSVDDIFAGTLRLRFCSYSFGGKHPVAPSVAVGLVGFCWCGCWSWLIQSLGDKHDSVGLGLSATAHRCF